MKCTVLGLLVLVGFASGEGVGDCKAEQECELLAKCPNPLRTRRSCETGHSLAGVCCRQGRKMIRRRRSIAHEVFVNALQEGHRVYSRKLEQFERTRKLYPEVRVDGTGGHQFHSFLQPPRDGASEEDDAGPYEDVFASEAFAHALNLTIAERVTRTKIRGKRCLPPVPCDPHARYRSIDGSCNNPVQGRSSWGAAGHPFERLLPPAYEDGIWSPRLHSVSGRLLASPRTISVEVFPDYHRADPKHNLLLMQFGQFMSHDFTRSASIRLGKEDIQCCSQDHSHSLHPNDAHFACLPIEVSPEDPFYSKFNIRCLNFVRLALARDGKCKLGYGKQLNKITHFIDGSTVYGSSNEVASSLRTFTEGKLKATFPSGEELLPPEPSPDACEPTAKACFRAGDDRSNQIVSLTTVHTLFLREHNRVATELARLNPHWNDEKLYQEARRIVIAEIQNLFYNEYLPLIMRPKRAEQYGLFDSLTAHTNFYSPDVKPLVYNELSGAAYRFGHSTVAGTFFIQHRHRRSEHVPIREFFLDPTRLTERSFFDDFLFSLIDQPQEQLDESTTRQLTRFLFAGSNPFGSDLVALNIQRGRDHALRPYNDYRQLAGLPRVAHFHQFGPIGEQLASVYESPDDVDLWVGGVLEPPTDGALFGETFATILGEQFAKLKFGDRYYYTNGPDVNPSFFTGAQLAQFRSLSLAAIICANVDHPAGFRVPAQAMLLPSEHNHPVACHHHPALDLSAWRQHQ